MGILCWIGAGRLAGDRLPGEVWAAPPESPPPRPARTYHYQSVPADQAARIVEQLRANRAKLYPCDALVQVSLVVPGNGTPQTEPGETFRIAAAAPDRWAITHANDEKSFVRQAGGQLLARMAWDPEGIRMPGAPADDGGPLSLPSWMMREEYVVAHDPEKGVVQLQAEGKGDPLLQATFHVELATGKVLQTHIVISAVGAEATGFLQLDQELVRYDHLDAAPALPAEAPDRDGDAGFEAIVPEATSLLAPPEAGSW